MAGPRSEAPTLRVLSNDRPSVGASVDPTICRCMKVAKSTIANAIAACNLTSVDQITEKTEAGGACMCCHRHLQKMLTEFHGERDVRVPAQLCAGPVNE
jgi:NAD(P)H-nitrite reductase large subunit